MLLRTSVKKKFSNSLQSYSSYYREQKRREKVKKIDEETLVEQAMANTTLGGKCQNTNSEGPSRTSQEHKSCWDYRA
jgi:hypothetical protein